MAVQTVFRTVAGTTQVSEVLAVKDVTALVRADRSDGVKVTIPAMYHHDLLGIGARPDKQTPFRPQQCCGPVFAQVNHAARRLDNNIGLARAEQPTAVTCQRRQANLCEDLQFINGAYAEFIRIPERIVRHNLLILPDDLSFREAAMTEPLACVVRAVEETGIVEGDTVVVIGIGPIGLMFVQVLKTLGARVLAIGKRTAQLELASHLGADHTINPADGNVVEQVRRITQGRRGADVVIEAVGITETWQQAMGMVRRGGTINLFGGCPSGTHIPLDTTLIHYSEITIKASFHHTPRHIREALEAIHRGRVKAHMLITAEESLDSLRGVLERLLSRNGDLKVAILP